MWMRVGHCASQINENDEAASFFSKVLETEKENDEAKIALATIYETLGKNEEAFSLIQNVGEVLEESKENIPKRRLKKTKKLKEKTGDSLGVGLLVVPNAVDPDEEEEFELDTEELYDFSRCKQIRFLHTKANMLYDRLQSETLTEERRSELSSDLYSTMNVLISDFHRNPFFYRDKLRPFTTYESVHLQKKKNMIAPALSVQNALTRDRTREIFERNDELYFKNEDKARFGALHGLEIDEWFELIVKIVKHYIAMKKHLEAMVLLKRCIAANIFYFDDKYNTQMRLMILSVSRKCGMHEWTASVCKYYMNLKPEAHNVPRLYSSFFKNLNDAKFFSASNFQKHLNRKGLKEPDNYMILLLHANVLLTNKSYSLALGYYLKAYKLVPDDPTLSLCIGVACLHLAMQRTSYNRHAQIAQGFSFLYRYYDGMGQNSEANYNMGRAYHYVNLVTHASTYYNKVLSDPNAHEEFLKAASYNLSLIYICSNNFHKSKEIMEKHMTF
jgi:general transcription factor 3C polypeptide 3 (transcription factor C subunit 4)